MSSRIQGILALLLASFSIVRAQHQPAEQVYLQTDKGIYEPGEDLWFKSYVLDRGSLSLSGGSRTLFVEMFDKKDRQTHANTQDTGKIRQINAKINDHA